MRWLSLCAVLCLGCESMRYTQTTPSVRTMSDDPQFGDYYIGADSQFVIADRNEKLRPAADPNRREVMDIWNPPLAWQPSGPALTNDNIANTSNDPLPGN